MNDNKIFNTRNLTIMGMMGALATVLMIFEFPIPFIAPGFYKMDLSEIPVLIGTFLMGPVAGIIIELVKILLNLLINGTDTGFVGEFANFCIGCALVVPAGIIYKHHKTKKMANISMAVGIIVMTIASVFLNVYIMLPFYSKAIVPMDTIIAAGAAIHPAISNVWTFCLIAVAPFNLVKGVLVSLVTAVTYKKVSVLFRGVH